MPSVKAQQNPTNYSDYDRGYHHLYYERLDSAYLMFNRYVNNADDSLKKGKAYVYMAEMLWKAGDLYGAQENLTNSLKVLTENETTHREFLGYTYKVLGNVSMDMKRYDEAIGFYGRAMSFINNADELHDLQNGKATALQKAGRYSAAIKIYDSLLALNHNDKMLLARLIDNRGYTKWLANHGYDASTDLHTAMRIRADSQYLLGLNASYAHLADYHASTNPDSAFWYANKMREAAAANHSAGDLLEAVDKLVRFSNTAALKEQWFGVFKKLSDSLQLSKDTTRNRFALIKYDVQKSKADNLALQQHISKQQLLIYGVAALALLIIGGLWTWYNKRRKRTRQEAEEAIRNERLKTSQRVHDVVANGLYTIMNELEHNPVFEREPMINKIEGLYEKSRNISYEPEPAGTGPHYNVQVHELLTSFSGNETKVIVVGNQDKFWNKTNTAQQQQLLLVLTELMVNMKKHSRAKLVSVVFKEDQQQGMIVYNDDGVGMEPGASVGNGLKNTVTRIEALKGAIIFGKSEQGGLKVSISFPLENGSHDR